MEQEIVSVVGIQNNDLLPYLKKIGTGIKGGSPLTYAEAYEAMQAILSGHFHPATLGGFYLVLRFRGETPEELAGFLDALHDTLALPSFDSPDDPLLDVAGAYDGKVRTLHVSLAASLLVAASGVRVIIHGSEGIPTKMGMGPHHVLKALRIRYALTPERAFEELRVLGITYLHQPLMHPRCYHLTPLRIAMGKRGFLNTLEPLLNPLNAPFHLSGFFHEPYGPLCAEAFKRAKCGPRRAILVTGIEGSDELRPTRSYFIELREGEVRREDVEPRTLGLSGTLRDLDPAPLLKELKGDDEEPQFDSGKKGYPPDLLGSLSAEKIRRFLAGEKGGYADLVLLSAGVRLYAAGVASSLGKGVEIARGVWEEGRGAALLDQWQKLSPLIEELGEPPKDVDQVRGSFVRPPS